MLWRPSSSFIDSVILILITAIISGLLIPIIKSNMDQRKYREQKKFEQELYRQGKRIEAQAKLLEDLNDLLWEFQLLSLEPASFRLQGDQENGEDSSKKYREEALGLLNKIRSQVGKARSLASPEIYQKLLGIYQGLANRLDPWLQRLEENQNASKDDWREYEDYVSKEVVQQIEDTVNLLAWDLGLARPPVENNTTSTMLENFRK